SVSTCVEEQVSKRTRNRTSQRPDLSRPIPPANAAYLLCKLADVKFSRVSIQLPTSITTLVLILLLYAIAITSGVGWSVEERARVPPDYMTRLYHSTTDDHGRLLAPPPYYADSILAFLDEKKKYSERLFTISQTF
ncbi:hypothetical protein TSMEX_005978, partial [Taenia solium]